jgi:hypothetical protein
MTSWTCRTLAALVTLAAGMLGALAAQAAPPGARDLPALEREFWDCDARATHQVLAPAEAMRCAELTDAVRQRRFEGDFNCFVAWWRERRHAEYRRRGVAVPGLGREPEVSPTAGSAVRCTVRS